MKWSLVLGILMLLAMSALMCAVMRDVQKWNEFKMQHNCVQVGHTDSQRVKVVRENGTLGWDTTDSQSSFQCNDGKIYQR